MLGIHHTAQTYRFVGLILFLSFVLQDKLSLKMAWLEQWQQQPSFKIYSGLLLITYLATLFIMPYNRHCKRPHLPRGSSHRQHQRYGTLAPLFFFIHTTTWGNAYLLLLSSVYFIHFLTGLFNHQPIKNRQQRQQFYKIWLPLHIIFALLLITLVGFHLYIVTSY